jgi:glyoxylase-like metal-dependent hydrolase (beta-lactamase superfamily II)
MNRRALAAVLSVVLVSGAAWIGGAGSGARQGPDAWIEVVPGVLRSPGLPVGYALVEGDAAILIDAPHGIDGLKARGVRKIDGVLLTHHHRDSCAAAGGLLAAGVKMRAPKASAEWLLPEPVQTYWRESLPLRNSRTAYLVVPAGLAGIDCSLEDGQTIPWHGWRVQVVASPGHSRDHVAFAARRGDGGRLLLFCGDAFAAPGKLWSPYTTDWDHWTDAGLTPAAKSLRKLAGLEPSLLLPAHGPVVRDNPTAALNQTAAVVEEMAFLKSFERYTKKRLGNPPSYRFLAKEQAESNGSKPWSQVAPHLFLTGNTYVLVSRTDRAVLVIDPWAKRSADQVAKLRADEQLGPVEVVMFSHAHYDHYDGIYYMADREKFSVWTLDQVAVPIADPALLRAPFLDARPVKIDRRPKDGETLTWREYRFRFHHLPGQSAYTMGVETEIDGKRCFFTADNWFHQDQFSGSGGWMGLNRSWPLPYAASAQKVLDARPDWVLAEHGGPFEFHAEDFRRRVEWGKVSARAADALCVSGDHRQDWDPHRVHIEPLIHKAKPGATLRAALVVSNPLARAIKLKVVLEGRGLTGDQTWEVELPGGGTVRRDLTVRLRDGIPAGRHVLVLRAREGDTVDGADGFLAVDVEP